MKKINKLCGIFKTNTAKIDRKNFNNYQPNLMNEPKTYDPLISTKFAEDEFLEN
jgi:hypothetical protein